MTSTPQERLLALHEKLGSWHKVAEELGVSAAMAWLVANEDHEPKDPEIRRKLGFREIIQQEVHRDKKGQFKTGGEE